MQSSHALELPRIRNEYEKKISSLINGMTPISQWDDADEERYKIMAFKLIYEDINCFLVFLYTFSNKKMRFLLPSVFLIIFYSFLFLFRPFSNCVNYEIHMINKK